MLQLTCVALSHMLHACLHHLSAMSNIWPKPHSSECTAGSLHACLYLSLQLPLSVCASNQLNLGQKSKPANILHFLQARYDDGIDDDTPAPVAKRPRITKRYCLQLQCMLIASLADPTPERHAQNVIALLQIS